MDLDEERWLYSYTGKRPEQLRQPETMMVEEHSMFELDSGPLSELFAALEEFRDKHADKTLTFHVEDDYECRRFDIRASRVETDTEIEARMTRYHNQYQRHLAEERAEYHLLKKKFGDA